MRSSQRIGVRGASGEVRYYDIDPDGRVYWLQPRRNNLLQRWRVREEELAEWIRQQASSMKTSA